MGKSVAGKKGKKGSAAAVSAGDAGKRRKRRSRGFRNALRRMVDDGVSKKGIMYLDSMATELTTRISRECGDLAHLAGRSTVTADTVLCAARLVTGRGPDGYMKDLVEYARARAEAPHVKRSDLTKKAKEEQSMTIQPKHVRKCLRLHSKRLARSAEVALAAVVTFVMEDVIAAAKANAGQSLLGDKRSRLTDSAIRVGLCDDLSLTSLFPEFASHVLAKRKKDKKEGVSKAAPKKKKAKKKKKKAAPKKK